MTVVNWESWHLSLIHARTMSLTQTLMMTNICRKFNFFSAMSCHFFQSEQSLSRYSRKTWPTYGPSSTSSSNNSRTTQLSRKLKRTKVVVNLISILKCSNDFSIACTVHEMLVENKMAASFFYVPNLTILFIFDKFAKNSESGVCVIKNVVLFKVIKIGWKFFEGGGILG